MKKQGSWTLAKLFQAMRSWTFCTCWHNYRTIYLQ